MTLGPNLKILLISENREIIHACQKAIPGYEIVATSFDLALTALNHQKFVLVLVDASSAYDKNLNFLYRLQNSQHQSLPVILILDRHDEKTAVNGLEHGVEDYVIKDEIMSSIMGMVVRRAIENYRWLQVNPHQSTLNPTSILKDPSTGLYNHLYFYTRLNEEIKRSLHYEFPLTLLYFEVQNWEELRNFSHEDVNYLIKKVGQHILSDIRANDLLARIHENGLGLLMPHSNTEDGKVVWNRVIEHFQEHPIVCGNYNIYVSFTGRLKPLLKEVGCLDEFLKELKQEKPSVKSQEAQGAASLHK